MISDERTTRTAAEALEKLIRLERNLEKKCHDLGYYNMIHVGLREFVEHAETFRAALAQPQEGEAEELARRFEAYADDADQHALLMVPIVAETLRYATRLLRATQSNGRSPDDALAPSNGNPFPSRPVESPAPSTPAQEGESTREQIDAGWVADLAYEDELKNVGYTHADRRERVRRILRAARLLRATQSNGTGLAEPNDDR